MLGLGQGRARPTFYVLCRPAITFSRAFLGISGAGIRGTEVRIPVYEIPRAGYFYSWNYDVQSIILQFGMVLFVETIFGMDVPLDDLPGFI